MAIVFISFMVKFVYIDNTLCKCTLIILFNKPFIIKEDNIFVPEMDDLFSYGPRSLKEFFRNNLVPVLLTVILHLIVAIVLVFIKVEGLKEDQELGVMIDFSEEQSFEEMLEEESIDVPAEWLEQVYETREKASNQAVNQENRLNEEISTQDYVNELLDELESQKDEDFLKDRDKWEGIISSYVYEENKVENEESEETKEKEFTGPTTIEYRFLEEPLDRKNHNIVIPVYRCEGSAQVKIDLEVDRDGYVMRTNLVSVKTVADPSCFIEAAEKAAKSSRFYSRQDAPARQVARVTYQFIAQ